MSTNGVPDIIYYLNDVPFYKKDLEKFLSKLMSYSKDYDEGVSEKSREFAESCDSASDWFDHSDGSYQAGFEHGVNAVKGYLNNTLLEILYL